MHSEGAPTVYHQRLPGNWWLRNQRYLLYMLREVTAVFAALWVVAFLFQFVVGLPPAGSPADAYNAWLNMIRSPGWVLFSLICLAFVLYHAYTSFSATGTLLYLRMGEKPVPGGSLNALMFLGWTAATIVLAFIVVTPTIGG